MRKILALILAVALSSGVIHAASLEETVQRILVGKQQAEYNDYNDSSPFSILYTGSGSAAALTISSGNIACAVTAGAGSFSITGFELAAYDTVGEVYDVIIASVSDYYTITPIDMRRADDSNLLGDVSAQSVTSAYNVLYDTAGWVQTAGNMNFTQIRLDPATSERKIRLFKVIGNADIASAGSLIVYTEDSETKAETTVWSEVMANETDKTLTLDGTNRPFGGWDFDEGDVVIIRSNGDEAQDAGADTQVEWIDY